MPRVMKHLSALVVILYLVMAVPIAARADTEAVTTCTLQQALDLAVKTSPDIQKAANNLDKTQSLRDRAYTNFEISGYVPIAGMTDSTSLNNFLQLQQSNNSLDQARKNQDLTYNTVINNVIANYVSVLKAQNNIDSAQLNLKDVKQQVKLARLAQEIGSYSGYDLQNLLVKEASVEESYKTAQLSYDVALGQLRKELNQSNSWQPTLVSKPVLSTYSRSTLTSEISRAVDISLEVFAKKQALDVAESTRKLLILSSPTAAQVADLSNASIDYAQAKSDLKATIEQLYYGIDILEKQIGVAKSSYEQSLKDLELAEYKYQLGLISMYSITPGSSTLYAAQQAVESNRIALENLQCDLATKKAAFALLVGKSLYDTADWSPALESNTAN